MQTYIYQLKDEGGKTLFGFMEAESEADLSAKLRTSNYFFIKSQKADAKKIFSQKVSLETLLIFTQRFSSLVDSGVPILTSMTILWRQSEEKKIQLVVNHIHRLLEQGRTISEALKDFPNIFSPVYLALVNVSEISGNLPVALREIGRHLAYQRETIMRIKKAMLYPIIVVVFAMLVLMGMFIFVVPIFQEVLMKLDVELPFLTLAVLGLSAALKSWQFWLIVVLLGVGAFFLNKYLKGKEDLMYKMEKYKFRLPVVGDIFYMISLNRFIHALQLLISSGLPIIKSFEVAKATTNSVYLNRGIDDVQHSVKQGASLYESIRDANIFPSMFQEMTGIGESSGRMQDILASLAMYFDQEVEFKQSRLLTFLEPLLIIFVGAIVILTLLAVYMPIFSIWQGLLVR